MFQTLTNPLVIKMFLTAMGLFVIWALLRASAHFRSLRAESCRWASGTGDEDLQDDYLNQAAWQQRYAILCIAGIVGVVIAIPCLWKYV